MQCAQAVPVTTRVTVYMYLPTEGRIVDISNISCTQHRSHINQNQSNPHAAQPSRRLPPERRPAAECDVRQRIQACNAGASPYHAREAGASGVRPDDTVSVYTVSAPSRARERTARALWERGRVWSRGRRPTPWDSAPPSDAELSVELTERIDRAGRGRAIGIVRWPLGLIRRMPHDLIARVLA